MKKQYIYKVLFLAILLVTSVSNITAQCTLNLTTTTKANCDNNGAVEVRINNPDDFSGIATYTLTNASGAAVTPLGNTNAVMTGLGTGNYTLKVEAFCKVNASTVSETRTITITTSVPGSTPLEAGLNTTKSRLTSLNSMPTGKITLSLQKGNGSYLVELTEHPLAYSGQTKFLVTSPGDFTIEKLNPSTTEIYKVKITDECDLFEIDRIAIKPVVDDLPRNAQEAIMNSLTLNPILVPILAQARSIDGFPTGDFKSLLFPTLFESLKTAGLPAIDDDGITINLNDHYNEDFAKDYYEFAIAYTAGDPKTWKPLDKESGAAYIFAGQYPYSDIKNLTNGLTFLPRLFIRLKENPSLERSYNVFSRNVANFLEKTVVPTTAGLSLKIHFNRSKNTWVSLPYQVVARRVTPIAGETNEFIIPVSDPNNLSNEAAYKIVPESIIPWTPRANPANPPTEEDKKRARWKITIEGESPGDVAFRMDAGYVTAIDLDAYMESIVWTTRYQMKSECGLNFGRFRLLAEAASLHVERGTDMTIPKTVTTIIDAPIPLANIPFKESSSELDYRGITLTPTKPGGYSHHILPPGLYKWRVDFYAEDLLTILGSQIVEANIPYVGEVSVDGSFTVTQSSSGECYAKKISLKMSELKTLAKRKLSSTSPETQQDARIQIFKVNEDGSSKQAISTRPSGFSFKNKLGVSQVQAYAYSFLISDMENPAITTWHAGSDPENPEFILTESGTFVITVSPAFDSNYDLPNGALGDLDVSISNAAKSLEELGCMVSKQLILDQNDLNKVVFDLEKSKGFRCNPSLIGTLNIDVTAAPGSSLTYQLTSVDHAGNSDGLYSSTFTTTDTQRTLTNIPVGVTRVQVIITTPGCVSRPAKQTIQIYDLDNPTLVTTKGGYICDPNGSTMLPIDLELLAVSILSTSYQWYYPDGTIVPAALGGNTSHATIPYVASSPFPLGYYTCVVTNANCTTTYRHKVNVTDRGGVTLYWAVDAANSNWNDVTNWRIWNGNVSTYAPDPCTDVVIPGKVTTYYPDLKAGVTTGSAVCRTVTFRYGGQVYHTENLTYEGAQIEYNTNYYKTLPTDDNLAYQPTSNCNEGAQPENNNLQVSGLSSMTRNRWWMIASPLKDIVTGDFQLDGKPNIYNALYNDRTDTHTSYITKGTPSDNEYISVTNKNDIKLGDTYNAMLVWIPLFNFAKGGEQDNLQDEQGKITLPRTNLKFKEYDMRTLALGAETADTRTTTKRFVYENASNQPGTEYKLNIKADLKRTNGLVMIGNPFMATINLQNFYTINSALIEDSFKILTSTGWENFTSASVNSNIAPLQGFVIKLKNPAAAATLIFPYATIFTPVTTGSQIKTK